MSEAQRCLKCYINTILEGSEQDGTDCVLCGGCVDVCPENCLELVPLDRIDFDSMAVDAIASHPNLFSFELEGIQPDELGSIPGTAMLKDETRCIRCGLCALRCPANTITMEAYIFGRQSRRASSRFKVSTDQKRQSLQRVRNEQQREEICLKTPRDELRPIVQSR